MLMPAVVIYIAVTLAIGWYASKRIHSTSDFTLAGRNLGSFVVGVTIFATWFGPELIMGAPALFIENGVQGIITDVFGNSLCLILVGSFLVGRLYRMDIVTLADFFRMRYGPGFELAASLIQVFTYFFWIAAQFVALGFLLQTTLGITLQVGILIGAAIVVVYTYMGGMWSVTLTDLLQSIAIILGLLFLLVSLLIIDGGDIRFLFTVPKDFYKMLPPPGWYEFTDYLAMWMAFGLGAIPAQEIYQRAFSAKTAASGRRGVLISSVLLFFVSLLPLIIALKGVDMNPSVLNDATGQGLIPSLVIQYTPEPVQILFFGALISAILSTSSGAMLSPATIIGENLIKPRFPSMSDGKLLIWTRISVIGVAVLSCLVAFNDSNIHRLVVASAVLLMVCLLSPLVFGLFWKRASTDGSWAAVVLGGLVWVLCDRFQTRIDPTIWGTLASMTGMMTGSLIGPIIRRRSL